MARRIPTAVLTVGLLVTTLLVGGRVAGTWQARQHPDTVTAMGTAGLKPRVIRTPGPPEPRVMRRPEPRVTPRPVQPRYGVRRVTGSAGVALTFDDGPDPAATPAILDLLRANRVKATFCLVGRQVRRYPALVRQIVREGHTLCNHSWDHRLGLGSLPVAEIRADLVRTNAEIRRAVPGAKIRYFRHPYGKWTPNAIAVSNSLGMVPLGWQVNPADWSRPDPDVIVARVLAATRAGSIVLLHDGGSSRGNTVTACRRMLPLLRAKFRLIAMPVA